MIKLKSIIYKYTGVYLAYKEEAEYIDSYEYWNEFSKVITQPENDYSARNIHGILIGTWQARHGFARPGSFNRNKIVGWFSSLYMVIKWDLYRLLRKFKK